MNKNYDIITKQPIDQLSQSISDMTFLYKDTVVPKAHYKQILNKVIEEEMNQIFTMNLLNSFTSTMLQMKNESPRLFYKAIMCIEKKISTTKQIPLLDQLALNVVADNILEMKKPNIIDKELNNLFENVINQDISTPTNDSFN